MDSNRTYVVSGVCCSSEEGILRKQLDQGIGRAAYTFNSVTSELRVLGEVGEQRTLELVRRAGFDARWKHAIVVEESFWNRHADGIWTGSAALLTVTGILLGETPAVAVVAHLALLAAVLIGGWKIFAKAFFALRNRLLDMNVLMTIAVCGALAIGKWTEGAAVIVLFSLALMLESYSTSRTRRAVRSLLALSPERCSVLRGEKETVVSATDVRPGELIVIRPGERLPLDGLVVEGSSSVNEATITGESSPVAKAVGATVFAGSLNGRGNLTVRVTRGFNDTTLAHIVHLIEEAQHQRAPVQSLIERFAKIYTPAVMALALLVAVLPPLLLREPLADWLYRALVLLVIACPCALVISTPITLVSALTNAARRGILIKGGRHIETVSTVRTVAFDKTGTLTEGKPGVTDILPLNSLSRKEVLRLVAAMEHRSEHPLASAVLTEATRSGVEYFSVGIAHFEALPGLGVRASIQGKVYYLGNSRLCEQRGFCSPGVHETLARLAAEGKTSIVLGCEGEPLAVLAFRDTIRSQSRDTIVRLRRLGVRHVLMLSGDHGATVERLAKELSIENVGAGLLPEDKVDVVNKLKARYGLVAMVGDGINDAPALAAASVGVAMGVAGSDAALDTADVVLMADDLSRLPHLFLLSQRTMAIVRQNIVFALSLKLVFLLLSIAGVTTLWMAVLADDGAALAVILNALRVLSMEEHS